MSDNEETQNQNNDGDKDDKKDEDIEFDDGNTDSFSAKLKKLKSELKKCQGERGEYLTGWQRAKADFINARKDDERKQAEFLQFANEKLLYDMLAVADSMEMALQNAPPEWLKHLYAQFLEIFRKHGVVPIESVGKKFDPSFHEAVQEKNVESQQQDNAVLEEYQKGYMIHDKVLRPAKVKIGNYKSSDK